MSLTAFNLFSLYLQLYKLHLLNAFRLFLIFETGAYLVNTARGKLCDRDVIAKALEEGQLAGYAGDVWFPQPPPTDHPWRTMPWHGMTPHTSGTTLVCFKKLKKVEISVF